MEAFRPPCRFGYNKTASFWSESKGLIMYHFHLTKYWFDKFKDGSKCVEYRFYDERLKKQIDKDIFCGLGWSCARLYCGYPKKSDFSRILSARVHEIRFPLFCGLPTSVREFMITNCKKSISWDTVFVAFILELEK